MDFKSDSGLIYTIYSREDNPDIKVIQSAVNSISSHLPHQTKKTQPPTIVSIQNDKERIPGELDASGFHRGNFVLLNSKTGADTFKHRLHEIAGLYRIDNESAHGLTWFMAYDQLLKDDLESELAKNLLALNSIEELLQNFSLPSFTCVNCVKDISPKWMKKLNQTQKILNSHICNALIGAQNNIRRAGSPSASQDNKAPLISYIKREKKFSYPIHAWGSAYIWLLINMELEQKGEPNLYKLIDNFPSNPDSTEIEYL